MGLGGHIVDRNTFFFLFFSKGKKKLTNRVFSQRRFPEAREGQRGLRDPPARAREADRAQEEARRAAAPLAEAVRAHVSF